VLTDCVVSHNLEVSQEGCVFSLLDERDNKQLGLGTKVTAFVGLLATTIKLSASTLTLFPGLQLRR